MLETPRYPTFKFLFAILTVVTLIAAGCGGEVSPTSPDQPQLPDGNFGAQGTSAIWGQLVGGGGGAATSSFGAVPVASAMGGVQVTIQGTSVSTTTNGDGQFLLNGVPHGSVVLQFSGGGANATLTLNGVGNNQLVQIVIQVQTNTASVVNQWVEDLGEFEGQVDSIDGDAMSFTLVDGTTIVTDLTTWWDSGGDYQSFDALAMAFASGAPIKAEGRVFTADGGVLLATVVKAENEALSVDDFRLDFSRDKWSLGWIDNGNTGTGNSAIEAYIKGGPFSDILASSVLLNGPDGSVAPFATELESDRFEARFTKSQVISVASSVPAGETVEVTVSGALSDGTLWELTAIIEISDDDDDDDDDEDDSNTVSEAVAAQAIADIQVAIDYLNALVSVDLMAANSAKPLVTKLESAIASLEKLNGTPAVNKLEAFLNQLDSAEKTGKIDETDAEYLEELIEDVIDLLEDD